MYLVSKMHYGVFGVSNKVVISQLIFLDGVGLCNSKSLHDVIVQCLA